MSLPEAVEQDHHGRPSFRVGGKIFATLWSEERMNVMVDEGGILTAVAEVYVCPVETSAEGTIAFTEFPAVWGGRDVRDIRLRFSEGRVVDASADSEQEFLLETLDTDEGARRIGELGIGCNLGIDRYMRNLYFDEKMNGTVHIALGLGFDYLGSTNKSALHWDIVKDLRSGGRIELDGKIGQENGGWL
jgi:aminopeptidase